MVEICKGDIFASGCQVLVNPLMLSILEPVANNCTIKIYEPR